MILEILLSVSYDHSILLDFTVSPETSSFDRVLVEYLEICIADWNGLVAVCKEMDGHGGNCSSAQGRAHVLGNTL